MARSLLLSIMLLAAASGFAQPRKLAAGTYSENGKLISLTNLMDLSDCPARSAVGRVKKLKVRGSSVQFRIKTDAETSDTVIFSLDRVSPTDRQFIFHHLITSKVRLRVAGYSCGNDGPISAFSIDRVY